MTDLISKGFQKMLDDHRADLLAAVASEMKAYRAEFLKLIKQEIREQVKQQMPGGFADALLEKTKSLHEEMAKRQNELMAGLVAEIRKSFVVKRSVERDGEGNIVGISEEPVYG